MKPGNCLRLLPGVIVVAGGLLALKAPGIVHDAYAQDAAKADAPAPANPDYAGTDTGTSAAEVDVLSSLSKRRAQLDARARQLKTQADILAATEARVDAKIAQLKSLQARISALLGQRDAAQQAQIAALVKTYGPDGMKPAKAAAIFNTLPDPVLVPLAQAMKPGDLGPILAAMSPDAAQSLTLKLANRLALPETTPPAPPAASDPAAAKTAAPAPAAERPAATKAAAAPGRHA